MAESDDASGAAAAGVGSNGDAGSRSEAEFAASFLRLEFEAVARQVYDRFLILRPEILVEGLFRSGREYVIVSPSLEQVIEGGRTVKEWFDNEVHPIAMPIYLSGTRPADAEELAPRTPAEVLLARGVVRTLDDVYRDLSLALPNDVPFVGVTEADRTTVVQVSRALTPRELLVVETVFESLGSIAPMRAEVVPPRDPLDNPRRPPRIELRTARWLGPSTPRAVRAAVEADEDEWRKVAAFSSMSEAAESLARSPLWPEVRGRSCLVATTFPPTNIRSYLSLYPSVLLVAPLKESLAQTLDALGIPNADALQLARQGFLRVLVPQSVERYDLAWLADLLEVAPQSVVLSRRLAAVTLRDQHQRNPLFALPGDAYEKRAVLRGLRRLAETLPERAALFLRALTQALSEFWDGSEYTLQVRGAMASLTGGLARFGTAITKAMFQKDLFIEIGAAAQEVEWAGALGAHLVPQEAEGYSSETAAGLLIALSSGVSKGSPTSVAPVRQFDLAPELLSFASDTDVLDFVNELGTGDLARFRELVPSIVRPSRSDQEVRELIAAWNAQVKKYERKPDRIKAYGLAGLALAAASQISPSETLRTVVPLIAPLVPYLTTRIAEDLARESHLIGRLVDWANGMMAVAAPDAVLLSRMRKQVAGMKTT
jgi:hypothetical protein